MRKIFKLGIIALFPLQLANVALAETFSIMSLQPDGTVLVTHSITDLKDWSMWKEIIEVAPPKGSTALILEKGKPSRWSTTPLPKLYRQLGGKGPLERHIFDTAYNNDIKVSSGSEEIELPEGKNKEIDLGLNGSALPRSGLWNVQLQNTNAKGCPSLIGNALARQSKAVKTREFSFTAPFHPTQLKLNGKPLTWEQLDPNKWRSVLADFGPNGAVKAKGMSFKVVWDVNIFSTTHILMKSKIDVELSKFLSAAFNGSQHCSVIISGDYKYIGD